MSTAAPPPSGGPPKRYDWRHLLAGFLVTLIATVTVTVAITPGTPTPDNPKPKSKVTVTLGGSKAKVPGERSAPTITLDKQAQQIVEGAKLDDALNNKAGVESDLHDALPPPAAALKQAKKVQPPTQPEIPAHVPLAAASEPGCVSSFVRNSSTRHGAPIDLGVIHWTGSIPTRDVSGLLAIVRWFDLSASQASSNYITDQAGRCRYVVPETLKSWTQAKANPWSVSVEIINAGVQPLFQTTAGRNAVIKLMRGWHQRWKLPYRLAAVNSNCVPIRSGFIDHHRLGPCGGGHPDVGTFDMQGLIRDAARGVVRAPMTKGQQHACDLLNYHRRRAHRIGHWSRTRRARANTLARQIPAGRCASKYRKA